VGSEDPSEWNADLQKPYGNPHIIEKTWASKIESYTGSAAWRIPDIIEKTYAKRTNAFTDVSEGTVETTIVGGGTVATTTVGAGTVESTTVGGGTIGTTVVGGGTVEATVVGGGTLGVSVTGLAAIEAAVVAGIKAGLEVVGGLAADISLTGGLKLDIGMANKAIEIRIGPKIEIETSDATTIGPTDIQSHIDKIEIASVKNVLTQMQTDLTAKKTLISTMYDVLAAQTSLL
jgi:hypothetical protein